MPNRHGTRGRWDMIIVTGNDVALTAEDLTRHARRDLARHYKAIAEADGILASDGADMTTGAPSGALRFAKGMAETLTTCMTNPSFRHALSEP